jgi:predicted nucleic acid-binding protein
MRRSQAGPFWTEDLQDGQHIDDQLTVKNPFAAS